MSLEQIAPLIKYLENNELVSFDILEEDNQSFVNRLKLQKYVYLAKLFDLDTSYNHHMYHYGPYSPNLTTDYYTLAEDRELYNKLSSNELPTSFRSNDFLDLVKNKNENWLEIATTLLDLKENYDDDDKLTQKVHDIKIGYTTEYISEVLQDLKDKTIIS